jgi:uncharacterized phage protein gp47/JayE
MTTPNPDFTTILTDAGLPIDEAGITAKLNETLTDAGSIYSNPALISPFKRLFTALITAPVLWLINALIISWMPQSFLLTATGIFLDALAWALGLIRKEAVKARINITFTRTDTSGALIIPAGTIIDSVAIDGRVYSLEVLTETTMADTVATLDVLCEATEAGSAWNLGDDLYSIVPAELPTITSVTNASESLIQPGTNEETDSEFRERCRNQFSAVNQWHIDAVYRSIISTFDGVISTNIYFDNDAPRGPGTCDAYILLETGNPSPEFLLTIQTEIMDEGNHGHGDDIELMAMPETLNNVTATAWLVAGLTVPEQTALMDDIRNFIRCAFRENSAYTCTRTQPLSRFSFSRLGKELHSQFAGLESIDWVTDDIISDLEIARIDTLTITQGA